MSHSNLPTLYSMTQEYEGALQRLSEMDLDEQTIADTLEGLQGAVEVKATNVAAFTRNLESLAEAIKDAEDKMAERRKAIEARASRLKVYLMDCMQRSGISKIESPQFRVSIRENPPSVAIDNEDLIPEAFMRVPIPVQVPDKGAIREALKVGVDVPGAHLTRTSRIEIK